MNPYEVLGVDKMATDDEIRVAYRYLAKLLHPDTGGNAALFRQVHEAYRLIGSPESRAQYNLSSGVTDPTSHDQWPSDAAQGRSESVHRPSQRRRRRRLRWPGWLTAERQGSCLAMAFLALITSAMFIGRWAYIAFYAIFLFVTVYAIWHTGKYVGKAYARYREERMQARSQRKKRGNRFSRRRRSRLPEGRDRYRDQ